VFWIGPYWEGRQFFRELAPGESLTQDYQGYGWEVRDEAGNTLRTVETVY
jgi:hypothetical protein